MCAGGGRGRIIVRMADDDDAAVETDGTRHGRRHGGMEAHPRLLVLCEKVCAEVGVWFMHELGPVPSPQGKDFS